MDFVHRLANRYNGGWSAAMRCARHAIPDIEWGKVEDAHSRREFEIPINGEVPDLGVTEVDIANADLRLVFEEEDQDDAINNTVNDRVKEIEVVIILDDPHPTAAAASTAEESLNLPDTEAKPAGVLDSDKAA